VSSHIERVAENLRGVAHGANSPLATFQQAADSARTLHALAARERDAAGVAAALQAARRAAHQAAEHLTSFRRGGDAFAASLVNAGGHRDLGPVAALKRGLLVSHAVVTLITAPATGLKDQLRLSDAVGAGPTTSQQTLARSGVIAASDVHDAAEAAGDARKKREEVGDATDVAREQTTSLQVDPDDVRRGGQG